MENINSEGITLESFSDFNLSKEVAQAIEKLGFKDPTPVQSRTFKEVMAGNDVIAMAQTGTGKTAAFGIPIAEKIDPELGHVQALALVPTRELALQVCRELGSIGGGRGIRSVAVYGGASFTNQVTDVKNGAQIVAGTPGRVLDHIRRGTISFDGVHMLVLDEADEMLSMGFEKEISEIIESLPKKRQTLLFSATIPADIARLTKRYMDDAEVISVSGDVVGAQAVSHFVYLVSGQGQPMDMVKVIEVERPSSAIIFCNTREETQVLAKYLQKEGYNADWLNSDLSQSERERVMSQTRSGKIKFLVATDVAARGIDVSHLSHVMNYSFPESLEIYVHRTGRTGRMGKAGSAVSLIRPQDIGNLYYLRLTYKIHPVEKTLPDTKAALKTAELDRMQKLRDRFTGGVDKEFANLSKRLITDVRAERIVAGMLQHYFQSMNGAGAQGEEVPRVEKKEGPAEHREARPNPGRDEEKKVEGDGEPAPAQNKTSVAPPDRPSVRERTPSKQPPAPPRMREVPRHSEPARGSKSSMPPRETGSESEIYIDAGRKDGLRIAFLMNEIMRLTGIPRTALGKVRMLTRSAFIAVPDDHYESVLEALGKIEIDGRRLNAEPAE